MRLLDPPLNKKEKNTRRDIVGFTIAHDKSNYRSTIASRFRDFLSAQLAI